MTTRRKFRVKISYLDIVPAALYLRYPLLSCASLILDCAGLASGSRCRASASAEAPWQRASDLLTNDLERVVSLPHYRSTSSRGRQARIKVLSAPRWPNSCSSSPSVQVSSLPRTGLRSRVRRFESCRGRPGLTTEKPPPTRHDAGRRRFRFVPLTVTGCLSQPLSTDQSWTNRSEPPLGLHKAAP